MSTATTQLTPNRPTRRRLAWVMIHQVFSGEWSLLMILLTVAVVLPDHFLGNIAHTWSFLILIGLWGSSTKRWLQVSLGVGARRQDLLWTALLVRVTPFVVLSVAIAGYALITGGSADHGLVEPGFWAVYGPLSIALAPIGLVKGCWRGYLVTITGMLVGGAGALAIMLLMVFHLDLGGLHSPLDYPLGYLALLAASYAWVLAVVAVSVRVLCRVDELWST